MATTDTTRAELDQALTSMQKTCEQGQQSTHWLEKLIDLRFELLEKELEIARLRSLLEQR